MNTEFRLIEFNSRRDQRGAEAARVAVIEDGEGGTFCVGCGTHYPVAEFTWEIDGSLVGS